MGLLSRTHPCKSRPDLYSFSVHTRVSKRIHFTWAFLLFTILALLALLGAYLLRDSPSQSTSFKLQRTAREILADPVRYATNRFTGGIGAALTMDPATALPRINGVITGSPAEAAGLMKNDLLLEVNHTSMKGKTLVQAVDLVRGLTVANVDILLQRNGTNLHCQVSRTSWTALRKLGNMPEPSPSITILRQTIPTTPRSLPPANDDLNHLPSTLPLIQTNF